MIRITGRWLVSAAAPFVLVGAAAAEGVGGPAAVGIPNFGQVAEGIWRGGRPTREGLLRLKELGVRTIVNREQWSSDRSRAEGTGLKCLQWPCNAMARPRDEEIAEILDVLGSKIAKWQMPDDVVFVDALPMTATGKISKKDLRAKFADYKLPG